MIYLSIDLETTGTDENKHQILEIGAIFEDTDKQLSFDEIPKFHSIIRPDGDIIGDPFALNMNKRIIEILSLPNNTETNEKYNINSLPGAIDNLHNWLFKQLNKPYSSEKLKINCAGKNFSGFDKKFLEKSESFNRLFRINNRTLDPAILYTNILNDETLPNTEQCMERAGLKLENHHWALNDAWNIILLLRKKYHILNGQ